VQLKQGEVPDVTELRAYGCPVYCDIHGVVQRWKLLVGYLRNPLLSTDTGETKYQVWRSQGGLGLAPGNAWINESYSGFEDEFLGHYQAQDVFWRKLTP